MAKAFQARAATTHAFADDVEAVVGAAEAELATHGVTLGA